MAADKAPKFPSNEKTVCGIVAHLVYNWRRISGLEKGGHAHQPLTHAWNTSGWADWGESDAVKCATVPTGATLMRLH
jgi:hypothetical protein